MYLIVCCVLLALVQASQSQTNVSLTTSRGPIIGLRWDPNPKSLASYDAFIGIPYGQIPGRFQPPLPRSNWSTPLLTQTDGPACPQPTMPFSEDCLYLNVFTPVNASSTPGKFPVMAFIHGSAFTSFSSSSLYFGPDFLVPQGIILVAMNYRLGAAGFLSLGSSLAPGNLGLLDTQLALKWIQQEISVFGGDPQQVTLAGQSAGSVSTMYNYLSPVSSAMFQRAIAQSGSALSTWSYLEPAEAVRRAKLLAVAVGCDTSVNDTQLLTCLQTKDINDIVNHQNITLPVENVASGNQLPFIPVNDTSYGKPAFFTDSVENLLKTAVVRAKPMITGFTTEEGILLFWFPSYKLAEANVKAFIPWDIQKSLSDGQKTNLGKRVESRYFPKSVVENKVLDIVNLYTDYSFAYPAIKMIKRLSASTYGYVFGYDGSWAPITGDFKQYHVTGVYHGADLEYIFYHGQDLSPCQSNVPNLNVRDNMVRWWTNFVKGGKPDPTGMWDTAASGRYLVIDSTPLAVDAAVVEERHYNFWANLTADSLNSSATTSKINIFVIFITILCVILDNY